MDTEKESSQLIERLLFPNIFQTFRMAIQPSKLIIAFLALAVICLAGWLMDFSKTVITDGRGETTELQVYMESVQEPDMLTKFREKYKKTGGRRGVFSTLWQFDRERFHGALYSLFAFNIPGVAANVAGCFKAISWAFRYHFLYCIIFGVIKLAVISVAGGAICRISALQFARGEKPGLTESLRFGAKKFLSLFTAPLVPVGIVVFIGLFVFLLGLVGNVPRVGELIMGVFMFLAFVAGALIAVVLIGAVAGFNLMFPAVAYDGSDCFDAISRSFSYVYSRPWRMCFYTAVAAVYGAICYIFARFFVFLLLWATYWALQLGIWADNSSKEVDKLTAIWPEPRFMNLLGQSSFASTNWSESLAAFLVYLLLLVVIGLLVSFIISFYFSANTIIYALMRNRVDNTVLEDISVLSEETQTELAAAEAESEESKPESETQDD
jgi:hypothetical protein